MRPWSWESHEIALYAQKDEEGGSSDLFLLIGFQVRLHTGYSHCATRGAALESQGKAPSISEQAADSRRAPPPLRFSHKQAQNFPEKPKDPGSFQRPMPSCAAILALGGADSRARRAERSRQ